MAVWTMFAGAFGFAVFVSCCAYGWDRRRRVSR